MPTVLHQESRSVPTQETTINSHSVEPPGHYQAHSLTRSRPLNLTNKLQENELQPATKMAILTGHSHARQKHYGHGKGQINR